MPVIRGVGESLPFVDESFDLIVCLWVLEHLNNPGATLREVRRVLRPGGHFVFLTPNMRNPLMVMNRIGKALPSLQRRLVPRFYGRVEADTFPVRYRANTIEALRAHAQASGLDANVANDRAVTKRQQHAVECCGMPAAGHEAHALEHGRIAREVLEAFRQVAEVHDAAKGGRVRP